MTMQEQIQMSGLEITPLSQLQWTTTNQWSPLLGGQRRGQGCVIVSGNGAHPICENDAQTVVVVGGETRIGECTNSVIIWDPSTKQWRHGPSLNVKRRYLVAVVCHDKVYAIGGCDHNHMVLSSMESIQVSSLLETETSTTRQSNNQWTRLKCRLLSRRDDCAAVVVQNRYVVIMGGYSGIERLSSVDIIDTAPHNNNNGEPTIVAGPSMNSTRYGFGAAVVDNRIFVVGGMGNGGRLSSVESLLFRKQRQDKDNTSSTSNASCSFPNSSWRVEQHLNLSSGRAGHAVAKVGSCLIVAGGIVAAGDRGDSSVEVVDIQWGVVWSLPSLTIPRPFGCSMVTLSDCLLVLGESMGSVESLALTVNRKHERCYKFLKFLIEIEFLGRPTRKRHV